MDYYYLNVFTGQWLPVKLVEWLGYERAYVRLEDGTTMLVARDFLEKEKPK